MRPSTTQLFLQHYSTRTGCSLQFSIPDLNKVRIYPFEKLNFHMQEILSVEICLLL